MTYKTILVQVDRSAACAARVEYAAAIAADQAAHLIGFNLTTPLVATPYLQDGDYGGYGGEFRMPTEEEIAQRRQDNAALRQAFERTAGAVEVGWREAEGDPAVVTALHARYADLVILGQYSEDESDPALDADFPASVAIESGRPVLVVPYVRGVTRVPKRIMVAWNASREATRAVADALPFLEKAERVDVLTANADQLPVPEGEEAGDAIAAYLVRHGVRAQAVDAVAKGISVGNLLLSRAADMDVDMLVMGAYGHSRLRERMLGGATRELLRHMTVPVLMAH